MNTSTVQTHSVEISVTQKPRCLLLSNTCVAECANTHVLPDRVPQALVIPVACLFLSKDLTKMINIPSPLTSSTSIIN